MTAAITEIPSRLRNVSSNDPYVAGADDIDFNKPASTGTTGAYPYNGMGRVVIPKKIVNGVNTLTHEAFEDSEGNDRENTIYVIQYDFTLGEDITIPANCVLEFEGGSISGAYTVTGNNTGIKAGLVKILDTDVTIAGTWSVEGFCVEWWGAKGDNITDNVNYINAAATNTPTKSVIKVSKGIFCVSDSVTITSRSLKLSADATIKATQNMTHLIKFDENTNQFECRRIFIEGGTFDGGQFANTVIGCDNIIEACIRNCNINGGISYGIHTKYRTAGNGYANISDVYLVHSNDNNSCVGIHSGVDDHLLNISLTNYKFGIYAYGVTKMTMVRPWLSPTAPDALFQDSIAFNIVGTASDLIQCVADSYQCGFSIADGTVLRGVDNTYQCNRAFSDSSLSVKNNWIFKGVSSENSKVNMLNLNVSNNSYLSVISGSLNREDSYVTYKLNGSGEYDLEQMNLLMINPSFLKGFKKFKSDADGTKYIEIGRIGGKGSILHFTMASGNASNDAAGVLFFSVSSDTIRVNKVTWFSDGQTKVYYKRLATDYFSIAIERKPWSDVTAFSPTNQINECLGEIDVSDYTEIVF